ncbi:MAG: AraC family transcriptional regulator, partial [Oscillospiraceae bacterium]
TIAEEMSLSASYVSTLFKKATGIAFSQYISQYRIDVAQDLLRNTNEKVSVVSEKAGFGTYNNFVRMFKKRIGVSPSQYRDDIRTENRKNGKNGKYGDEDNRKME